MAVMGKFVAQSHGEFCALEQHLLLIPQLSRSTNAAQTCIRPMHWMHHLRNHGDGVPEPPQRHHVDVDAVDADAAPRAPEDPEER